MGEERLVDDAPVTVRVRIRRRRFVSRLRNTSVFILHLFTGMTVDGFLWAFWFHSHCVCVWREGAGGESDSNDLMMNKFVRRTGKPPVKHRSQRTNIQMLLIDKCSHIGTKLKTPSCH